MVGIYKKNIICRNCVAIVLAILCLLPGLILAQTPATAQNTPAPIGRLVDVGGYRVHLYCIGAGSPTVVIVGAGLSFDWGLIQPEVAKLTQVCSYDHSGTAWSDSGPTDSCSLRVGEVHAALKNAGIKGPYALVGHSHGALVARLYAGRYPDEVAGMVFVDHAFAARAVPSGGAKVPAAPPPPQTSASSTPGGPGPMFMGMESDPNFSKLSSRDRELHHWAVSQPRSQMVLQAQLETMPECLAEADALAREHPHPLGDKPLINVSTDMGRMVPGYGKFQSELLTLSQNSKEIIAEKSSHFVIIDRPDVVVDAVSQVVRSVRDKARH
jgi:pimeloyl-ACP methyl ester carboxylesterase